MQIELRHLMPVPLKDRFASRPSEIWNTDLIFKPGERIKIKAPSGTGKTTFIHIIYKLRGDYEGTVTFDARDIRQMGGDELAAIRQKQLSIVFQDLRLFPNLTARENIELKRLMQKPFCEGNAIDAMAEKLGIAHVLNQPASICSYGEQQRIAIIRALVQPFNWLVMDEPFSHLDLANTAKAAELITEECLKRNAGFVLTDLDEDNHFNYTRQLAL